MTNEQTSMVVFKDQAGEYYLLPLETLERGRVPTEHTAEVERLISEQHGDVRGYMDDGGLFKRIADAEFRANLNLDGFLLWTITKLAGI